MDNDTPVPNRVTNKQLYEFMIKNADDRADMKEEIIGKIAALELKNETRLTYMETCIEKHNKVLEKHDKKIDKLGKGELFLGALAAVGSYFGIKMGS